MGAGLSLVVGAADSVTEQSEGNWRRPPSGYSRIDGGSMVLGQLVGGEAVSW